MIKKLASFLLISVILTSCNTTTPYQSAHAKEYGYFTYPGTDWGMTQEEYLSESGMELSDFTVDDMQDDSRALVREMEFAGKNCVTRFEFVVRQPEDNEDLALIAVRIFYPAEESNDFDMLCSKIDEIINPQEVEVNASLRVHEKELADGTIVHPVQPEFEDADALLERYSYRVESVAQNRDLPQEIKDNYDRIFLKRLEENPNVELPNHFTGLDSMQQTLSSAGVTYEEDKQKDTIFCLVSFSGRGMEEVYGLLRAYEPETYEKLFH